MRDEVPGDYDAEIEIARIRQISRQRGMTLAEIFGSLSERLKNLPTIWHENGQAVATSRIVAGKIIEAIELEGFFMSVSQRGFLVLSRADGDKPLQPGELGKHFQILADSLDIRYREFPETHTELNGDTIFRDHFLPLLRNQ